MVSVERERTGVSQLASSSVALAAAVSEVTQCKRCERNSIRSLGGKFDSFFYSFHLDHCCFCNCRCCSSCSCDKEEHADQSFVGLQLARMKCTLQIAPSVLALALCRKLCCQYIKLLRAMRTFVSTHVLVPLYSKSNDVFFFSQVVVVERARAGAKV